MLDYYDMLLPHLDMDDHQVERVAMSPEMERKLKDIRVKQLLKDVQTKMLSLGISSNTDIQILLCGLEKELKMNSYPGEFLGEVQSTRGELQSLTKEDAMDAIKQSKEDAARKIQ